MPRAAASRAHSSGNHKDEIQFAVAFKIMLVGRLWRARFAERAKQIGQTDARWTALYMIADATKGITQVTLADRLGVQGPTLVRLLDALEQQGLISRAPVPDDRRVKIISILPKGQETLAEIDKTAATFRDELFAEVSEKDIETTLQVLRALAHQLEPHHAPRVGIGVK